MIFKRVCCQEMRKLNFEKKMSIYVGYFAIALFQVDKTWYG